MSNKRYCITEKEKEKLEELRGCTLNLKRDKSGSYRCRISKSEIEKIRQKDQQKATTTEQECKKLGEVTSSEEHNQVTDMGDYYEIILNNGERRNITKELILQAYEIYTRKNTTIDKACLKLGITRTDFMVIKRAFKLNKTSYRYPDFCFDKENYDLETMTEYENMSRKIEFVQNVQEKKSLDQERRLKRYDTIGYWHNKALQELKDLARRPIENKVYKIRYSGNEHEHILVIADTHLGIKSNNPFNKYSTQIAEDRFKQLAQWMYDNSADIHGTVNILDLGDAISGYIHGSIKEQNEIPVTTQLKMYVQYIEDLLVSLSAKFNVTYRICCGNHARIYENKQDDINEANLETLIPMYLSARLSDHPRIEIFDQSPDMITGSHDIKMFDYHIGAEHGNRVKFLGAADQWTSMYQRFFKEILVGHFHCRKSYTDNGTTVESFPSISGTDEYASNIKKFSKPEATLLTYDKSGRTSTKYIYLK